MKQKLNRITTPTMTFQQQQTIASGLVKGVRDVAEHDFVCLPEDMLVGEAVKVMRNKDVSSILVSKPGKRISRLDDIPTASSLVSSSGYLLSHKKQYVGILTERDILYRVMAENRGPYKVTIGLIMSSPLITIDQNASVREAITLMQSKQIRRLPVVDDNDDVVGLVTLKTVIGNMPSQNIDLAELESSRAVAEREAVCPYCRSVIRQGSGMAAHMSGTHMRQQGE